MRDSLGRWWNAPQPTPPLSLGAVLAHAARGAVRYLPLYALVVAWQYASVGAAGVAFALGGGAGLLLAFAAGALGALGRKYAAAVAFGLTIAVVGRLGPFVARLGGPPQYLRAASLALVLVCAAGAVVGYAEVRQLRRAAGER